MLYKLIVFVLSGWGHFPEMPKIWGIMARGKVNSLKSVASNTGSHMLSPWDPQDSATTWYHSTFHCGEREENLLRPQRIPSVIIFLSFFLSCFSNRPAGVWVKADPLPIVHFNIRKGKEVSPVVRNLCPYMGLASSARPCGILGILADLWVSYFHMDELYSITSSVYQELKSVDVENTGFFFFSF